MNKYNTLLDQLLSLELNHVKSNKKKDESYKSLTQIKTTRIKEILITK